MAELTKVTTPMVPRENMGGKYKPSTDQSVDFNDLSKVNKSRQEGKVDDRPQDRALQEQMGRAAMAPLLRELSDMTQAMGKMLLLLQVGTSASEAIRDPQIQQLLQDLYFEPGELLDALRAQSESAVLFRGGAFDLLREILGKFEGNPRVRDALVNLLKTFEQNVNSQNSVKTILFNCTNILDYMFSRDKDQFESYLQGLSEMLLPREAGEDVLAAIAREGGEQREQAEEAPQAEGARQGEAGGEARQAGQSPQGAGQTQEHPPLEQREIAQILKSNLLPLLGEIVVKYHQNERIRDIVMVVVHNIVRLDQGTPENLQEALTKLVSELRKVANLPAGFEQNMMQALLQSGTTAKYAQNDVMEKLAQAISAILHDSSSNPAVVRQAETLMMSMLQNEGSMMNVLHFILPMNTPDGQVLAEMYVDPDSEQHTGRSEGKHSRKVFLAVDSEHHGRFELSFLETDGKVDFSMWCPEVLVDSLGKLRRQFSLIMQAHGYTMLGYEVSEMKKPHNIVQVFPHLLDRRVGIDVRI